MQALTYKAEIGAEGEITLPRLRLNQGTSVEVTVRLRETDSGDEGLLMPSEGTTAFKDNPADEWEQPAQQPLPPSGPIQQAREFYDTELRPRMEESYNGQYVAIHPETRSYNVQPGYGKAFRELRTLQPLGPIIVHNIGFAGSGLKARLRGEQP